MKRGGIKPFRQTTFVFASADVMLASIHVRILRDVGCYSCSG